MAKIIELIYTHERRGTGKEDNIVRMCPQLYTKDGKLIAEYDPVTKEMYFQLDQINEQ